MAGFSRSILFPVALCLALQAHLLVAQDPAPAVPAAPAATPSAAPGGLIAKACEQANHKDFCIILLTSDKNSQTADLRGLAYIALRTAEKNATATSLFIKQQLDKPEGGADGLSDCGERYISAVELIEDSISALVSDQHNDVNNFAKAAVADLVTCDLSMQGQGGGVVEVVNKNNDIRRLINTALTIVHVAASQTAR